MIKLLAEGDVVLLIDSRGREYLTTLTPGKVFHSHLGKVPHEEIIGQEEACRIVTHAGRPFLVLRPTLAQYVMKMRRDSTIVYPKDVGAILVHGDIYPGATVIEAGAGSGALTLALLRATGPEGRVITYELREDMAQRTRRNIASRVGEPTNFTLKLQDIYQGIDELPVDRIVLDLPEPWQVVPHAATALRQGGIFVSYVPTVLQVHHLAQTLSGDSRFELVDSFEIMHRGWHLAETSARPDHRMVAHTGFITTAVRCAPRPARVSAVTIAAEDTAAENDDHGEEGEESPSEAQAPQE